MKKNKKFINILARIFGIIGLIWFALGIIGLSFFEFSGNLTPLFITFRLDLFVLIFFIVYITLEFFIVYYKSHMFYDEDIRTFTNFLGANIINLLVSALFAFLFFTAKHLLQNISHFLINNSWVFLLFFIIVGFILLKFVIYKMFVEKK